MRYALFQTNRKEERAMTVISQEIDMSLAEAIAMELDNGENSLSGSSISSAIKTVAALDFKMSVASLPDRLLDLFSETKLHPDHCFSLDAILARLVG
jgi:hypothetical protein